MRLGQKPSHVSCTYGSPQTLWGGGVSAEAGVRPSWSPCLVHSTTPQSVLVPNPLRPFKSKKGFLGSLCQQLIKDFQLVRLQLQFIFLTMTNHGAP